MNSALLSMLDSEKMTEVKNTSGLVDIGTMVLMLMEITAVALFVTLYW